MKCNQDLNNEVIYKVENAHGNKTIASMWNIQRMSFKVVCPHYYNNFFARVKALIRGAQKSLLFHTGHLCLNWHRSPSHVITYSFLLGPFYVSHFTVAQHCTHKRHAIFNAFFKYLIPDQNNGKWERGIHMCHVSGRDVTLVVM